MLLCRDGEPVVELRPLHREVARTKVDTLLWLVSNRFELSTAARAIDRAPQVFVSAASAFEIGGQVPSGQARAG